ncbi:hypothetical protein ACOMHN_014969 [Nucella lapillus]
MAVFGIGFHDDLAVTSIKTRLLQPILQALKSDPLAPPHLLWAGLHSMGMMKSPSLKHQSNPEIRVFNRDMKQFLDQHNVSMFDTYNLTSNMMSFDGTHYGFGVNFMKAKILFHYIQELASQGRW